MHARLHLGEKLFAYLDDVWLVSQPERVGEVHIVAEHELWTHAKIQVHRGKIHVWNRSARKPPSCDEMQRVAEAAIPTPESGVVPSSPRQNRASKYWGALWGMKIS